jgi:hypothetical protein
MHYLFLRLKNLCHNSHNFLKHIIIPDVAFATGMLYMKVLFGTVLHTVFRCVIFTLQ